MLCSLLNFFLKLYQEYNWLIKKINIEEGPPASQCHTQLLPLSPQLTLEGNWHYVLGTFTDIFPPKPETALARAYHHPSPISRQLYWDVTDT